MLTLSVGYFAVSLASDKSFIAGLIGSIYFGWRMTWIDKKIKNAENGNMFD